MNARYDALPDPAAVTDVFGEGATGERSYDLLTVDVPADHWIDALTAARDELGCAYFDWLSAVDEPGTGFQVCAHVFSVSAGRVRALMIRTTVAHDAAELPTAVEVYAGADWHERETHEMFGVSFTGHPNPVPLLLPENFEGHPLRKDFVLAARVVKAWPGAKEPGESAEGHAPRRRQMLPPGVPDPNEWGPRKGQAAPAGARRTSERAATGRTRATTAEPTGEPTAEPTPPGTTPAGDVSAAGEGTSPRRPRRARSASQGSASQRAEPPRREIPAAEAGTPETGPSGAAGAGPRRNRSASGGSASQREIPASESAPGGERPGTGGTSDSAPKAAPRGDAPWHTPRPAFDDAREREDRPAEPESGDSPDAPDTDDPDTDAPGPDEQSGGRS